MPIKLHSFFQYLLVKMNLTKKVFVVQVIIPIRLLMEKSDIEKVLLVIKLNPKFLLMTLLKGSL